MVFNTDWYKTHGHPRGMLGKKHSDEYKKEMSVLRKGRKLSKEWAENISRGKMGIPRDEATKKKISIAHTGKKMSKETREKISNTFKEKRKRKWRENISKSRKKRGVAKGDKNPNWKGGLKPLFQTVRDSDQYKEWWWAVFKRDKYKCIVCHVDRGPFNVNHKKPFSVIMRENNIDTLEKAIQCKELWDINNGETMCEKCHRKTDTYGWRVWNKYLKGGKN